MLTKRKLALWVTLGITVVVTVLRVVLTPLTQSMDTGMFAFNYALMGVILVTFIVTGILLWRDKAEMSSLPVIKGRWLILGSLLMMAVGICLLVVSIADFYNWSVNGVTPPPQVALAGSADRITLFLALAFGILGGVYLIRLGFAFLTNNKEVRGVFPIWALAPAFWVWMRLARYEVSYASAVGVHESFFDFTMLLCAMLFLFSFARQMSDVDARPWKTVWYAGLTVIMNISCTLSRVAFFLLGQGDAYRAGQLADVTDFAVGLLALGALLYWVLAPQTVNEEE